MSNTRHNKPVSRHSSKFNSPKSFQSSLDRYRTFTESSDDSDNEETRQAFSSLTTEITQLVNELTSLKSENASLKEQLNQTSSEKHSLAAQLSQCKEVHEKEIFELKRLLVREEEVSKKCVKEAQMQRMELENRVSQVLGEKMAMESALKKTIEKNKISFKRAVEGKDLKISKLMAALGSVKRIETQVKSMLTAKESYKVAQSAGDLPKAYEYKHIKSNSCAPHDWLNN